MSEGISLQVLKRGEIILTKGTSHFNPLYKWFWVQRVDALTPASFLRYGTLHSAQRVEVRQSSVGFDSFPRSMSPQGWDFSRLVRARDRESAHHAGSFWEVDTSFSAAPSTTPGFPVSMQDEVRLLAAMRPGHTSSMKTPEHSFWPKDNTQ